MSGKPSEPPFPPVGCQPSGKPDLGGGREALANNNSFSDKDGGRYTQRIVSRGQVWSSMAPSWI